MNTLVIVPLILCIIQAYAADKQEVKAKTTSSAMNTIQQSPKYEMIYQPIKFQQPLQQIQLQPVHQYQQPIQQLQPIPQYQQKPQYVPLQIIPKQYYVPQPQPQAMIIIAQPALVPQSLVYGSATQQLLNYFHSNPQAKYQLLHGQYQQPQQIQQMHQPQAQATVQPTATYMHQVLATPSLSNYILATPQVTTPVAPQPQLISQTSSAVQYRTQQPQQIQVQHTQQQPQHSQLGQQQPTNLNSLAHLAQLAAQQYVQSQMKTAPAIVTGFEHFTPEQQAQIKAQLSSHLGTNFHAVSSSGNNQYSSKYAAEPDNNDFIPSPQIKNEPVTTVSSQTTDILKNRYLKGKN